MFKKIFLSVCVLLLMASVSYAYTNNDSLIEQLQAQITALESQITEFQNKINISKSQVQALKGMIEGLEDGDDSDDSDNDLDFQFDDHSTDIYYLKYNNRGAAYFRSKVSPNPTYTDIRSKEYSFAFEINVAGAESQTERKELRSVYQADAVYNIPSVGGQICVKSLLFQNGDMINESPVSLCQPIAECYEGYHIYPTKVGNEWMYYAVGSRIARMNSLSGLKSKLDALNKEGVYCVETSYQGETIQYDRLSRVYWTECNKTFASKKISEVKDYIEENCNKEDVFEITKWTSLGNNSNVHARDNTRVAGYKIELEESVKLDKVSFIFDKLIFDYIDNIYLVGLAASELKSVGLLSRDFSSQEEKLGALSGLGFHKISDTEYRLDFENIDEYLNKGTNYIYLKINARDNLSEEILHNVILKKDSVRILYDGTYKYGPNQDISDWRFRTMPLEVGNIKVSSYSGDEDKVEQVSENVTSNSVELGSVVLKSENDTILETITFDLHGFNKEFISKDITDIAKIARIYSGDTLLSSKDITGNTITFDDIFGGNLPIDTSMRFTVKVDIPKLTDSNSTPSIGDYVYFEFKSLTTDNNDTYSDVTYNGSAKSAYTHMYPYHPTLEKVSATITKTAGANGSTSDIAEGTIKFNLKAVGADIFIDNDWIDTSMSAERMDSILFETNASQWDEDTYVVYSGETKRFTISGVYVPEKDSYVYYMFNSLIWGTDSEQYTWNKDFHRYFDGWKTSPIYIEHRENNTQQPQEIAINPLSTGGNDHSEDNVRIIINGGFTGGEQGKEYTTYLVYKKVGGSQYYASDIVKAVAGDEIEFKLPGKYETKITQLTPGDIYKVYMYVGDKHSDGQEITVPPQGMGMNTSNQYASIMNVIGQLQRQLNILLNN